MRLAPAALLSVLALAACESPRQACLSDASRQLRIVESLIQQTQGNIQRGYAIEEDQVLRTRPTFCEVRDEDGEVHHEFCHRTEVRDVSRPVAIDLGAEQAKLDGLLERRATLTAETAARQQACLATYPE